MSSIIQKLGVIGSISVILYSIFVGKIESTYLIYIGLAMALLLMNCLYVYFWSAYDSKVWQIQVPHSRKLAASWGLYIFAGYAANIPHYEMDENIYLMFLITAGVSFAIGPLFFFLVAYTIRYILWRIRDFKW